VAAGDAELRGRVGFVRERGGKVEAMGLIGGTRLRLGEATLTGEGSLTGRIISVRRTARGDANNGFVLADPLPEGTELKGRFIIVTHPDGFTHGYEIAAVRPDGGQTFLEITDEPGFEIDADGKTRMVYFPPRESEGENRFEVVNVAVLRSL
jgi:hypothetical protein